MEYRRRPKYERSLSLPIFEIIPDRLEKFGDGYGFRKISFAAALPDLLLVTLHGKSRYGDNGDRAQLIIVLQPLGDLQTGHFGKLDVHQDEIGHVLARE